MPEMGEYAVGAWLSLFGGCEAIVYNQKLNPKGVRTNEVDVIGLVPSSRRVYLCEVATHLGGLLYSGGNPGTKKTVERKFHAMFRYASRVYPDWECTFMLWAPYVPKGILTEFLQELKARLSEARRNIEVVINGEYTRRVEQLRESAKGDQRDRGEPFYRALQILENLRPQDAVSTKPPT